MLGRIQLWSHLDLNFTLMWIFLYLTWSHCFVLVSSGFPCLWFNLGEVYMSRNFSASSWWANLFSRDDLSLSFLFVLYSELHSPFHRWCYLFKSCLFFLSLVKGLSILKNLSKNSSVSLWFFAFLVSVLPTLCFEFYYLFSTSNCRFLSLLLFLVPWGVVISCLRFLDCLIAVKVLLCTIFCCCWIIEFYCAVSIFIHFKKFRFAFYFFLGPLLLQEKCWYFHVFT